MIPVLRDINRSGVSAFAAERARRILNGAALAFNNNVRTRGVIATGAPTINVGTGTAPSQHTRVYTFGDADMPFVSSGGRPTTASGRTTFPVVTPSSTRIDFAWRVETIVDGDSVAFLLDSVTANGYRFIVDGQYVSATTTTSAAGTQRYYQLSWATKAKRRVVVEGTRTLGFWGAAVKDMDGCFLPGDVDAPRLFVVGDSDLFMQDFEPKGDNYGFSLGDYLGIRDTWCNGISSTGFVVNGGGNNYGGRRADWTTLPANSIDVLLFQLSYNDFSSGIADATLKAAIAAEITAARAAHPDAFILFTGCASWNDGSTQVGLAEDEVLAQQAIAESGDPLVGYIPVYTRTANWRPTYGITAAGDTGTGNTSRYVSFSSDHMNNAGNIHFGEWLARRVIEVIADLANVSAPTPVPAQSAVAGGGGAGGVPDFRVVTAGETLADDDPLLAVITSSQNFPLPPTPEVGDVFELRVDSSSSAGAIASVDPGAGRRFSYGAGQLLPIADTLTCGRGEGIAVICRDSTTFEVLTPGTVGVAGPPGESGGSVAPLLFLTL